MTTRQTGAEFTQVTTGLSSDLVQLQRFSSSLGYYQSFNITLSNLLTGGLDFTTLNLGASGTQGTLNIFPSTASSGKLQITDSSTSGNFTTIVTLASQAAAHTYTIPDAGASASFVLTAGNQSIAGNKTLTGTTQANTLNVGASGTAGTLTVYPATAANGTLVLSATNNASNFAATITNAAIGQATVYTVPDAGAATAQFLLDHGTNTLAAGSSIVANKVNGTESSNAVTASGMSGVITTSSLTTVAGSSYAITWTNTFISSTSTVLLTTQGGTNTTVNNKFKVVPGSGTATLTIYNTDPSSALNGTILIGYLVI